MDGELDIIEQAGNREKSRLTYKRLMIRFMFA